MGVWRRPAAARACTPGSYGTPPDGRARLRPGGDRDLDRRAQAGAGPRRVSRAAIGNDQVDRTEAIAIPAGRSADPAEIGAAIAFLASAEAAYINGTVLTVDGGRTEAIW